jgi:hypothetical protein
LTGGRQHTQDMHVRATPLSRGAIRPREARLCVQQRNANASGVVSCNAERPIETACIQKTHTHTERERKTGANTHTHTHAHTHARSLGLLVLHRQADAAHEIDAEVLPGRGVVPEGGGSTSEHTQTAATTIPRTAPRGSTHMIRDMISQDKRQLLGNANCWAK